MFSKSFPSLSKSDMFKLEAAGKKQELKDRTTLAIAA